MTLSIQPRPIGTAAREHADLRRARWSMTTRLTLLTTVVVLLVECLVYLLTANMRADDAHRDMGWAVDHSSISSPPACTWLVVARGGDVDGTAGLPAEFPLIGSIDSVRRGGPELFEDVAFDDREYSVLTRRRGDEVVQVVYDKRFPLLEQRNLLVAFAIALLLTALVVAAVVSSASRFLCERAVAPLNAALARQRRFVADASHELRAPLTQLHTRAQLLARKAEALDCPPTLATEVRRLVNGTRHLGDVVDDILRSALVGGPGEEPAGPPAVVDLAALADEVVAAEDVRAAETGLVLRVRREPGRFLVPGAESALRRVVTALVDNAIGHTPVGGEVVVTLDAPDLLTVRLSVRDNGVGFDEADGPSLFTRFSRGHHGRGQRFGIGLALVREVVESHHGTVSAKGSPGEGAVFTVELPAVITTIPLPRTGSAVVAACLAKVQRGHPARG
ncbi:HAMP domain-containing sensor histidine kinase [Umezawaea sp. Da 62-37]|uniref:sensor histidine kinase n=1 Tax=Umezawaea sp. Da 62-37 TaxID=3075927 RepID=UPI0028F6E51C|nr:HAMP domain-containing sensor histidine kinase [Umezawaea sp. Da 62-37]WNV88086.1 HAMP domain-containing sensor histidine kinase [Umezawaea sp. Da 62-37]